jgi:hypothetical protein
VAREVGATGNGHRTKPLLVSIRTVVATHSQREAGFVGCVALNLIQGIGKVFVQRLGIFVVFRTKLCDPKIRVRWDCVRNF